jgi:hypothetical protein
MKSEAREIRLRCAGGAGWGWRLLLACLCLGDAAAQEILLREGQTNTLPGTFTVPFAFYSGALGPSVGASIGNRGLFQPQASTFATVVGSAGGSLYGFLAVRDLEVPQTERLFINGQLNVGRFSQIDIYADGNPDFAGERAGSNGSDPENFITGDGSDVKIWTLFGYVLPLGSGMDDPKSSLVLRDGVVVKGARDTSVWNPFWNGYTLVGIKPFYRNQNVDTDEAGNREIATAGAEFIVHYENTDFHENPSHGSIQQVRYTKDGGELGSSAPWETVDFTATKFVPLARGPQSRQRVLALSMWWIDTPRGTIPTSRKAQRCFIARRRMPGQPWAAWIGCVAIPRAGSTTGLPFIMARSIATFRTGIRSRTLAG